MSFYRFEILSRCFQFNVEYELKDPYFEKIAFVINTFAGFKHIYKPSSKLALDEIISYSKEVPGILYKIKTNPPNGVFVDTILCLECFEEFHNNPDKFLQGHPNEEDSDQEFDMLFVLPSTFYLNPPKNQGKSFFWD